MTVADRKRLLDELMLGIRTFTEHVDVTDCKPIEMSLAVALEQIKQLDAVNQSTLRYKQEYDRLTAEMANFKQTQVNYSSEIDNCKSAYDQLEAKTDALSRQNTDTIEFLRKQLQILETELDRHKQRIAQCEHIDTLNHDLQQEIRNRDKRISELEPAIEQLNGKLNDCLARDKQLAECESRATLLTAKHQDTIDQLIREHAEYKQQCESRAKELSDDCSRQLNTRDTMHQQYVNECNARVSALTNDCNQQLLAKDKMHQAYTDDCDSQATLLSAERNDCEQRASTYSEKVTQLISSIQDMEQAKSEMETKMQALTLSYSELQGELSRLQHETATAATIQASLQSCLSTIEQNRQELLEYQEENKLMHNQLTSFKQLQQEAERLNNLVKASKDEELKQEIEIVKLSLESCNKEVIHMRQELGVVKNANSKLQARYDKLVNENTDLWNKYRALIKRKH